MTPEEFERLKAKEREHLEKMRELKTAVKQLEKQRSVVSALERMREGASQLLDEQARLVEDLARDTAFMEAKADLATGDLAEDTPEIDEEALQKIRAQKLIEAIKAEDDATAAGTSPTEPSENADDPAQLPEKTIGRMRP